MSDDERIQRLTELARRVWPDQHPLELEAMPQWQSAAVRMEANGELLLLVENHPRAFDALEAALLVLADEPPAWAQKLADEWYASAKKIPEMMDPEIGKWVARILGDCASELLRRERAKGRHG